MNRVRDIAGRPENVAACRPWAAAALATALLAATILAGCQREGGLAPLTHGGDALSGSGALIVSRGDSLYDLARRYQVPLRDLIDANRLSPPYTLEPGQRLVLPASRQYIVKPGDTLYGVSRMHGVDVSELTRLNNLSPPYGVYSGQALRLPAAGGAKPGYSEEAGAAAPRAKFERTDLSAAPPPTSAPAAAAGTAVPFSSAAPSVTYVPGREPHALGAAPTKAATPLPVTPVPVAPAPAAGSPPAARPAAPPVPPPAPAAPAAVKPPTTAEAELRAELAREAVGKPAAAAPPPKVPEAPKPEPAKSEPAKPASEEAEVPPRGGKHFLMPLNGKTISGYGPKPGGLHNDGLNIAASKGTAVVAADNGVVAYAGNELRGFGNLLLIRHADGWVTAYAHLDRFDVARGAEVKRGQKIGTVGQSGGVAEPQLHFELRRGNQAVDPRGMM